MFKITAGRRDRNAKLYVNGILHLAFNLDKLRGLQAWIASDHWCSIEMTFDSGVMLMEYDDPAKWRAVLKALDELL